MARMMILDQKIEVRAAGEVIDCVFPFGRTHSQYTLRTKNFSKQDLFLFF